MKSLSSIASLLLLLSSSWAQRTTITETEYRTTTSVVTLTSNFVCAKLVGVTGACRQGRDLPSDQQSVNPQIAATKTLGMDVTSLAELQVPPPEVVQKRSADSPAFLVIEPSMPRLSGRIPAFRNGAMPGIFFLRVNPFYKAIPSPISITITNFITQTETLFRTMGATSSLVFKGCTPNYFPYPECPVGIGEEIIIPDENDIPQFRRLFTKTKTSTTTTTTTITVPTTGLCAQLVNVTGACRRRRGLWIEDPIVLTFDDDLDAIDAALSPTSILSIETTPLPEMMTQGRNRHFMSDSVVRPSSELEDEPDQRLGFNLILDLKNALVERLKLVTTTVTTVTVTTIRLRKTSIKTFFVQLCTPSPFPFDVCGARKKRSVP